MTQRLLASECAETGAKIVYFADFEVARYLQQTVSARKRKLDSIAYDLAESLILLSLIVDHIVIPPSHMLEFQGTVNIFELWPVRDLWQFGIILTSYWQSQRDLKDFLESKGPGYVGSVDQDTLSLVDSLSKEMPLTLSRDPYSMSHAYRDTFVSILEQLVARSNRRVFGHNLAYMLSVLMEKESKGEVLIRRGEIAQLIKLYYPEGSLPYGFMKQVSDQAYFASGAAGNSASLVPSIFRTDITFSPNLRSYSRLNPTCFDISFFRRFLSAARITLPKSDAFSPSAPLEFIFEPRVRSFSDQYVHFLDSLFSSDRFVIPSAGKLSLRTIAMAQQSILILLRCIAEERSWQSVVLTAPSCLERLEKLVELLSFPRSQEIRDKVLTSIKDLKRKEKSMEPIQVCPLNGQRCGDVQANRIMERRNDPSLRIVFGYQFSSDFYDTALLVSNLEAALARAARELNETREQAGEVPITYHFKTLSASRSGSLFCDICMDIQSSDIAFFEVSNRNPNVMLEYGLAIGSNTILIPLRDEQSQVLPTHLQGIRWYSYRDNGMSLTEAPFVSSLRVILTSCFARKRDRIARQQVYGG
jgi:hypothetical protein